MRIDVPPYHDPLIVFVDKITSAIGAHTFSTWSSASREAGESPADESDDEDYPPGVELFLRLAPTRLGLEGQIIPGQLVSSPGALVSEGDALFSGWLRVRKDSSVLFWKQFNIFFPCSDNAIYINDGSRPNHATSLPFGRRWLPSRCWQCSCQGVWK